MDKINQTYELQRKILKNFKRMAQDAIKKRLKELYDKGERELIFDDKDNQIRFKVGLKKNKNYTFKIEYRYVDFLQGSGNDYHHFALVNEYHLHTLYNGLKFPCGEREKREAKLERIVN